MAKRLDYGLSHRQAMTSVLGFYIEEIQFKDFPLSVWQMARWQTTNQGPHLSRFFFNWSVEPVAGENKREKSKHHQNKALKSSICRHWSILKDSYSSTEQAWVESPYRPSIQLLSGLSTCISQNSSHSTLHTSLWSEWEAALAHYQRVVKTFWPTNF